MRQITLSKVKEVYYEMTPEQKQVLIDFVATLGPGEITVMRTQSLSSLITLIQLELLAMEFVKRGDYANDTPPAKPMSERLALFALAWYHINEFWVKLEEVPTEPVND